MGRIYRVIEKPDKWVVKSKAMGVIEIPRDGRWRFDGNYEFPTFSPSLNETWGKEGQSMVEFKADPNPNRNHCIITVGRIQYLTDCTHALRGTIEEIVPLSEAEVCLYYGGGD